MGGGAPKAEQQMQKQSWDNLNSLFSRGLEEAGKLSTTGYAEKAKGAGILDEVGKYWRSLLSGDRNTTQEVIAPAANAVRSAADTSKREVATMGTSRGGGTAGINQQSEDRVQQALASLVGGVKPAAAQSLQGVGEATAQLGANDIAAMMHALGLGGSAASSVGSQVGSDINSRREASAQMWSSLIGGAARVGAAFI